MSTEFIGVTAGTLTTLAFLPQVIQVFKSRSTRDISLGMYLMFCTGVILWIIYSLVIHSLFVFLANVATLALAGTVLFMKLWFKT